MALVKFYSVSQQEYDGLDSVNNGALYFTNDTHRIYRGTELYSNNLVILGEDDEFPTSGVEGLVYVKPSTHDIKTWDETNDEWVSIGDYLPLSGGTVTGDILRDNSKVYHRYASEVPHRIAYVEFDEATWNMLLQGKNVSPINCVFCDQNNNREVIELRSISDPPVTETDEVSWYGGNGSNLTFVLGSNGKPSLIDNMPWNIPDLNSDAPNFYYPFERTHSVVTVPNTIPYVYGPASATHLGGIKVGSNLTVDSEGVLSAVIPQGVQPSDANPSMDGTANSGTSVDYSRADHVHPTDTSRAAATDLDNYLPLSGGTLTGDLNISGATLSVDGAVTFGNGTIAGGEASHAEGYYTSTGGQYSHAEGYWTIASGESSHAEGGGTAAEGAYSHAEGDGTHANGYSSHAEGCETTAESDYSHAEGYHTEATGDYAHAEGSYTVAHGDYSHAEGDGTTANGDYSHAEGYHAKIIDGNDYAFAWNGDIEVDIYESHGEGTFNINPVGGLSGFYIGDQNLNQIFDSKLSGVSKHIDDSTIHVTSAEKSTWNSKQAALIAGDNIHIASDNTISVTAVSTASDLVSSSNSAKVPTAGAVVSYVTEQIADLEGALQFIGVVPGYSSDNTDEQNIAQFLSDNSHSAKTGDVVIMGGNCKEYIYVNVSGATPGWREIGDEGMYVHKSQSIAGILLDHNISIAELTTSIVTPSAGIIIGSGGTIGVDNSIISHINDTNIHVTASDKTTWDGKQDALTAGAGIEISSGNTISNIPATTSQLGGVKIGANLTIDADGTLNATVVPQVNADWNSTSGVSQILNKPNLAELDYLPLSGGTLTGNLNLDMTANLSVTGAATIGSRAEGISIGNNSLAQGMQLEATGDYSHAEGNGTMSYGEASHAEGSDTTANGEASHAEGAGTSTYGSGSHAEGYYTFINEDGLYAHAEGIQTESNGWGSHAEGDMTTAVGDYSHAEGAGTWAAGAASHTEGYGSMTRETDDYAFAWNGDDTLEDYYESHGAGTFNINPVNGLSGFYIGNQDVNSMLLAFLANYLRLSGGTMTGDINRAVEKSIVTITNSRFPNTILTVDGDIWDNLWRGSEISPVKMTLNGVDQTWSSTSPSSQTDSVRWTSDDILDDELYIMYENGSSKDWLVGGWCIGGQRSPSVILWQSTKSTTTVTVPYVYGPASTTNLGGVKVGANLSIDNNGVLSANDGKFVNGNVDIIFDSTTELKLDLTPAELRSKLEAGSPFELTGEITVDGTPEDFTYTVTPTSGSYSFSLSGSGYSVTVTSVDNNQVSATGKIGESGVSKTGLSSGSEFSPYATLLDLANALAQIQHPPAAIIRTWEDEPEISE